MRIRISHSTSYAYSRPADGVIQALRVTPAPHDGQRVLDWRIDVDVNGVLREGRDAFGNILHVFYADQPVRGLTVRVTGEVETQDTAGVISGAPEPFAPAIFLRPTGLTQPDPALRAWAGKAARGGTALERLHGLMGDLHARMIFETGTTGVETDAGSAFGRGRGVCQDYAHIFIAAARSLGIPARYVSGHLARGETADQDAAHAWAEAWVEDLGWIGFDAANGVCPSDSYVRVATGLDYLEASPLRGARRGGGDETMTVAVRAHQPARQRQD